MKLIKVAVVSHIYIVILNISKVLSEIIKLNPFIMVKCNEMLIYGILGGSSNAASKKVA
jgi:hypothetical protein